MLLPVRPHPLQRLPWQTASGVNDPAPNGHAAVPDNGEYRGVHTGRILVVEDESIVALDLRNTLRRFGHTVVALADSGHEAINQARLHRPDVILMDIRLRGQMDGIEAAEIIARELRIPIIYMTAQADVATRERAEQTMPVGYLLKPFVKKELATLIEVVLGDGVH